MDKSLTGNVKSLFKLLMQPLHCTLLLFQDLRVRLMDAAIHRRSPEAPGGRQVYLGAVRQPRVHHRRRYRRPLHPVFANSRGLHKSIHRNEEEVQNRISQWRRRRQANHHHRERSALDGRFWFQRRVLCGGVHVYHNVYYGACVTLCDGFYLVQVFEQYEEDEDQQQGAPDLPDSHLRHRQLPHLLVSVLRRVGYLRMASVTCSGLAVHVFLLDDLY